MRRLMAVFCLVGLGVATVVIAQPRAQVVGPEVLDAIEDDEPNPLPRSKTSYELTLPVPRAVEGAGPPAGSVETPAEYESNHGLLIRWGSFNDLLTAMTVGITTGDPDGIVYILVETSGQQSSAESTLTTAGADLSQVEFVLYDGDSVWMRDYGPRFIYETGVRSMVDHTYNRPRPRDNAFPDHLSALWSEPQYDIPLTHGGGNFHLFANGDAFMTDLILDENPPLDAADVEALYADYQNLDLTIVEAFPSWYDSTQHIDMWMLPVDDTSIIVGEYPVSDTEVYDVTESTVTELESRGYTVHRTPGWEAGAHYTYTNSVIFNELVFACQFDGYPTENASALATYEAAFPDHQVIPVDCSSIIFSAGAIHCIVMHVPDRPGLFVDGFESGDTAAWTVTVP